MSKELTREQAETKQRRAVQFLRNIGQDEDADRFEAMSLDGFAAYKGFTLINPSSRFEHKFIDRSKHTMTEPTKSEVVEQAEIADETIVTSWDILAPISENSSKEDMLDAIEAVCEEINDYDPDRFPIEDESEEEVAA